MEIKVFSSLPKDALDLRITVFVDEQGFVDEVDEADDFATHLVMYDDEKAVATCRFFLKEDKETYMFGRLCVLKEYRGKSFGREMLKKKFKKRLYNVYINFIFADYFTIRFHYNRAVVGNEVVTFEALLLI